MIMLLPIDMKPENSLYYYGSIVLEKLYSTGTQDILTLYQSVKECVPISIFSYSLTLDWLYMINAVIVNQEGSVTLCSSKA